jgi:hypothetical protein
MAQEARRDAAVQDAYAAAFPQIKEAMEELHALNDHPHMRDAASKAGAQMAINWQDLAGKLTGEFCRDWPVLKKAVSFIQGLQGIPFLSFIAPQIAAALALVSPLVAIVDRLYPQVCPITPPAR